MRVVRCVGKIFTYRTATLCNTSDVLVIPTEVVVAASSPLVSPDYLLKR